MDPLSFTGRLTPNDYLEALYLHGRPNFIKWLIVVLVLLYIGVLCVYGTQRLTLASMSVLLFPLLMTTAWQLFLRPQQIKQMFYQNRALTCDYTFAMTLDGLVISSDLDEVILAWDAFSLYKSNRTLTLLYRSDHEFYIFPHRWLEGLEAESEFFYDRLQALLKVT